MSTDNPLNTAPIQQFIQQVRSADASRQKEIRLDIATSKRLAFALGEVMARLHGDLEKIVIDSKTADEIIQVEIKGDTF